MENNDEIDVEYHDEMPAEEHNPRSIQAMMGWLYDKPSAGLPGSSRLKPWQNAISPMRRGM